MVSGAAMLLQGCLGIFQMWQIEAAQVAIVNFNLRNVLVANVNLCLRCAAIRFDVLIAVLVL